MDEELLRKNDLVGGVDSGKIKVGQDVKTLFLLFLERGGYKKGSLKIDIRGTKSNESIIRGG